MSNKKAVDMANTIRSLADENYQDAVPLATTRTLPTIIGTIFDTPSTKGIFLDIFFTKCALAIVQNRVWKNKLERLKKGKVVYGEFVENAIVNPIDGEDFDKNANAFTRNEGETFVEYFKKNSHKTYTVTVDEDISKEVFMNDANLQSYIQAKLQAVYNGASLYEYNNTLGLIKNAISKKYLKEVAIDFTDTKECMKQISGVSADMTYINEKYNPYAKMNPTDSLRTLKTFCPESEQVLIVTEEFYRNMNFDVLATMFNMEKAQLQTMILRVDSIGTSADSSENGEIFAILCDEGAFQIRDFLVKSTSQYLPKSLATNYFYHVFQSYALSSFANMVAFKKKVGA